MTKWWMERANELSDLGLHIPQPRGASQFELQIEFPYHWSWYVPTVFFFGCPIFSRSQSQQKRSKQRKQYWTLLYIFFLSTCLLRQGWFVWFVSVTCWPHSDANSVTSKSLATGMPGSCIRNGGDYPGDAETAEKGESSRNGLEIFPLTCENMVISWILNGNTPRNGGFNGNILYE